MICGGLRQTTIHHSGIKKRVSNAQVLGRYVELTQVKKEGLVSSPATILIKNACLATAAVRQSVRLNVRKWRIWVIIV